MNPTYFDEQTQKRIVVIKKMAKVDIMGARREVDQLRREFVTAMASSEGNMVPLGLWRDMAIEIDELDKFDMPPEKKTKRRKLEDTESDE